MGCWPRAWRTVGAGQTVLECVSASRGSGIFHPGTTQMSWPSTCLVSGFSGAIPELSVPHHLVPGGSFQSLSVAPKAGKAVWRLSFHLEDTGCHITPQLL